MFSYNIFKKYFLLMYIYVNTKSLSVHDKIASARFTIERAFETIYLS